MSNEFAVNTSAVNTLTEIDSEPDYPALVITCGWRALRHEWLIARDGAPCHLKTLLLDRGVSVVVAFKQLKEESSSGSPQQTRRRRGYVSPCALQRAGFTGRIRRGDSVEDGDLTTWHVDAAHLQKVEGEAVRWVLDLAESG